MPAPVQAQTACAPHDEALALFAKKYQEQRIATGVTNGGERVEVLASKNGGTWTILVTLLDGRSCLVSAGEGWNTIEPKDEGPGA